MTADAAAEPDGEGLDGRRRELAHQRHDQAGIDTAAEKRPEADVAHQVTAHRLREQLEEAAADFCLARVVVQRRSQRPVA